MKPATPQKLKIVLLGDSGVGKTSLVNAYVGRKGSSNEPRDVSMVSKDEEVDGRFVNLEIHETGGHVRPGSTFFNNARGCILVYDVNNTNSLANLENWRNEFLTKVISPGDPKGYPFVVIGNKYDIDGGSVKWYNIERAKIWCGSKGPIHHEVASAKENHNVNEAFRYLVRLVLNHTIKSDGEPPKKPQEPPVVPAQNNPYIAKPPGKITIEPPQKITIEPPQRNSCSCWCIG